LAHASWDNAEPDVSSDHRATRRGGTEGSAFVA
jgi:hypothetical protein